MSSNIGRLASSAALLAGLVLATPAASQCNPASPNCASQNNPKADELKDFSRRLSGEAFDGPATQVRIRNCGPNVRTRYVANLPIALNLCGARGCDELSIPGCAVPGGYVLSGNYSSVTRLNDPCPNPGPTGVIVPNPRIGTFSARGSVRTCSGAVKAGASWTLEGTIGTNTSTPPLREGCGECYACHHHTGILRITGLRDKPHCAAADITAFVQFNTNQTYCSDATGVSRCNDLDACEVAFIIQDSTVDGVYRQPCCHNIIDHGGPDHPDPSGMAVEDELIDLDLEIDPRDIDRR